jgi:hypothetical protein
MTMSVPDEGYYRNTLCALNLISAFLSCSVSDTTTIYAEYESVVEEDT